MSNLPKTCPFDGCDWTPKLTGPTDFQTHADRERWHEQRATEHYERQHAGRVRVRAVLERDVLLGPRDPHDAADAALERLREREDILGFDVAYTVAEVVEEPDDHPDSREVSLDD